MTETQGLLIAFGFGCVYHWLITKLIKSQFDAGFITLWVVIGVFMVLAISALVHVSLPRLHLQWDGIVLVLSNQQHAAIYELKFFMAAGLPIIVGSLWRYLNSNDWLL